MNNSKVKSTTNKLNFLTKSSAFRNSIVLKNSRFTPKWKSCLLSKTKLRKKRLVWLIQRNNLKKCSPLDKMMLNN